MSEVAPGVWAPMDFLSSYDPLQGGYQFCSVTDGGKTYHPGADLNAGNGGDADLGVPLRMPVAGEVVYVRYWDGLSTGYGNHLWLRLDSGDYLHYCHANTIACAGGKRYPAGTAVAAVGKSGNQGWAHLHLEVKREDPALAGYDYWPYGQSEAYVRAHYVRPSDWWNDLLGWAAAQAGEELAVDTTPEEREAMRGFFEAYGVPCNMETALMKRAALAHKREETPGPALSGEYPHGPYVRQTFTARTAEYHPDDGQVYWVELNKERPG